MAYKYFPHTEKDIATMLEKIGISSLKELYADVPDSIMFKGGYNIDESKSETISNSCAKRTSCSQCLPVPAHTTITLRL
jgi:glycine cleavage system pyridoxal-binding protein P